MINNNLSDYLMKSKYGKGYKLCYINKIMLFFEFQKVRVSTSEPPPPLGAPLLLFDKKISGAAIYQYLSDIFTTTAYKAAGTVAS